MLRELEIYTLNDLKRLRDHAVKCEIKHTQNPNQFEDARGTTALASLVFATIELLGICLDSDKALKSHQRYTEGRENAKVFFKEIQKLQPHNILWEDIDLVYEINRNGIVHSLFPKLGTGIAYNGSWTQNGDVFFVQGDTLHLNVAFLTYFVIHALQEIINKAKTDPVFLALFESNFQLYVDCQTKHLLTERFDRLEKLTKERYNDFYVSHIANKKVLKT